MKFNFKWNRGNKQEITPEITEREVNVYKHPNTIKGAEHLGEKKCRICGKWFKPSTPVQVLCSQECRMEADRQYQRRHYQEMMAKRKEKLNEQGKEEKMYSEPIIRANGRKWTPPIKTCPTCGKTFVATNNKQIYCCHKCLVGATKNYNTYRKTPKNKTASPSQSSFVKKCTICGKEFTSKRSEAKYCSEECRAEAARRISRSWWRENGAKKRGYDEVTPRPDFWHTQAGVIVKLVKSGVDDDIVAKYLKTVFGEK